MIKVIESNENIKWVETYDGLDEEDIQLGHKFLNATLGENTENNNRCFASIAYNPEEHYADVEVWINGAYGNYTIDKHEGTSISAMKSYVSKHLSEYLRKLDRWSDT